MRVPFFSACVPVYNGSAHLKQCLDSILAQSFQDFEIVVVDDGSTDDSVSLVQQYAKGDPRIVFQRNPVNLGLVANWNRCLELATGTWVKFLFQDDFWAPSCLERVQAHTAGRDLVFHGRRFVFEGRVHPALVEFYNSQMVKLPNELAHVQELSKELCCQLMVKYLALNFFGEPSSVAFRRQLTTKLGNFDERLVQLCDYEYWTRIASNSGAYRISEDLSCFRVHGAAASSTNMATREFRYRYLDRLIVFERFRNDPLYAEFRRAVALREPQRVAQLYATQQMLVAQGLRELPRVERREASAQLLQFVPGAHAKVLRLAKRRFGIARRGVARLLRRVVARLAS